MFERSIKQFLNKKQVSDVIQYNNIVDYLPLGEVYCPMCQDVHKNNTLCQLSQGWGE